LLLHKKKYSFSPPAAFFFPGESILDIASAPWYNTMRIDRSPFSHPIHGGIITSRKSLCLALALALLGVLSAGYARKQSNNN